LYTVLVVIGVGKSQVRRSKHRWEHNIQMNLKENGLESLVNDLAQNRDKWRAVVSAVKTFRLRITWGGGGFIDWPRNRYLIKKDSSSSWS
jgi:hypothetical protein